MKLEKSNRSDLVVAAALSAAVTLILPLQTFLGNGEIYPFALGRLLPELFGLGVGAFVVLVVIQRSAAFLRLGLSSLYAALLVCVYLESGLLSAGIPELNGGFVPMLSNVSRGVVDAGVWIAVIVGFMCFARRLRPVLHWISLAILVLFAASLLDIRSSSETSESSSPVASAPTASFVNQESVVANVKYSSTRNILIFILDSMPAYAVAAAVRTNAALTAKFDGFTAYTYNIGMHECTKRGVPGLVTGHYYDPAELPQSEYPLTMYGTNSFLTAAVDSGWNVAFSPDLLPYGMTTLPVEKRVERRQKRSRDKLTIMRQSTEVPHLSIFDLVAFRLSPFFFKGPILYSRIRHAVKGRHSNDDFWGEAQMYPTLAGRPANDDGKPFLGGFHSWGAHPPLVGGFAAAVTDKLSRLGELFDAYRAKGLYDKSLILVTTDHGRNDKTEVDGYPDHASALLWVKSEGAHGPWTESDVRTSHAKIAPLVRKALTRALSADDICETLKAKNRLYRAPVREGLGERFVDWRRE